MAKNIVAGIEIKAFDGFSRVMGRFQARLNNVARVTNKAQKRFNDFRNATMGLSMALRRMALAAGFAFTAITALVIRAGSKFEDAMAELSALTGIAGDNLIDMGKSAIDASKKFGLGASDIATSMTRIASAKSELMKDTTGLKRVTDSVLVLSKISGITPEQAGVNVIDTMNIFGIEAQNVATIVDQLAQSARVGKFPVNQLTTAFNIAGKQAQMAGLDIAQYTGAIQTAALSGQSAGKVGIQLRQIFTKMAKAFPQLADGSKSFVEVIEWLRDNGNPEILEEVSDVRSYASLKTLIDNVGVLKTRIKQTSEEASKGQGLRQFGIMMDTLNTKAAQLWATINDKLINIFLDFAGPVLKKVVDGISKFVEWIFSGSVGARMFNLALGAVAGTLTIVAGSLGFIMAASTWQMFVGTAIPAIIAMGAAFHASTGGVFLAIGAIVSLVGALWSLTAWFRTNDKQSFFKVLLNDLKAFWRIAKGVFEIMKGPLLVLAALAAKKLMFFLTSMAKIAIPLILTGIKTMAPVILAAVAPFLLLLAKVWAMWQALKFVFKIFVKIGMWIAEFAGFKPIDIFDEKNLKIAMDFFKVVEDFFSNKTNMDNPIIAKMFGAPNTEELDALKMKRRLATIKRQEMERSLAAESTQSLASQPNQNKIDVQVNNTVGADGKVESEVKVNGVEQKQKETTNVGGNQFLPTFAF